MKKGLCISLLLILVMVSCSANEAAVQKAVQTAAAQTGMIDESIEAGVVATQTAMRAEYETLSYESPTPSLTPLPPTATPKPKIIATLIHNANCRQGPDGGYEVIQLMSKGDKAVVIGQNTESLQYWQLELEDGRQCWVVDENLSIAGDTSDIPEVEAPLLTDLYTSPWVGTWTAWQNQCFSNSASCENSFSITWVMTGPNTMEGSYSTGGCAYTDILTLSSDQMHADGIEIGNCGTTFEVHLVMDSNMSQFRGRWNVQNDTSRDGYYCGARNGMGKPNPTRP